MERAVGALGKVIILVLVLLLLAFFALEDGRVTGYRPSMSLASIPGNSAEILYTLSSSLMSIAGTEKLDELVEASLPSLSPSFVGKGAGFSPVQTKCLQLPDETLIRHSHSGDEEET